MGKTFFDMCRYYKGEAENPYEGDAGMFWNYEKWWVESFGDKEKEEVLFDAFKRYIKLGLESFEEEDGTPMVLKALLFNRYEHWLEGGSEDFKEWYKRCYKDGKSGI